MAAPHRIDGVSSFAVPARSFATPGKFSVVMSDTRTARLVIVLAALASLALLLLWAPAYLTQQGFPLDDAWIHAVYGRSVARSGMLAYNPGIPATGATSPLWALLLALPQLLAKRVGAIVVLTKLLGFGLHVLAALMIFAAFAGSTASASGPLVVAALVVCHPDLVAASVSGMEVPLATLIAASVLCVARRGGVVGYALLAVAAALARPELAVLCYFLPILLFVRRDRRRLVALSVAAGVGNAIAFGGMALRNLAVSGLPLPATFYAKVGGGGMPIPSAEMVGFGQLLGHIAIADSGVLLLPLAGLAAWLVLSRRRQGDLTAAAALLGGLLFCAISFVLIRPVDPDALYHQRYVLPVIPLIVAGVPMLAIEALSRLLKPASARVARIAVLGLLAVSLLLEAPRRYERLAEDARNIDDVQVAVGRALASASPADVVWAVDAGAVRYFGNAFVVDLMGLNNASLLGSHAQAFLDAHPPSYIEIVPTWSMLDEQSARQLEGRLFRPSTAYTVTSFPAMQRHWLVRCPPTFAGGELQVRGRLFRFSCARGQAALPQVP